MRTLIISVLAGANCACVSLDYYAQAVAGHFEIWRKQQPIDDLLLDPALPAVEREKLEIVLRAREFAFSRLALPDNGSYRDFVRLDRDFVVWNVFVAPALALAPEQSCFLFVGCLSYRGYFDRAQAERYAAERRADGFDVYVAGVAAYSTLGWFDDPVLSSILAWDEIRIVEILFHELSHQRLYINDDTTFNESFAVAVAAAGLNLWLAERTEALSTARAAAARESELMALVSTAREALETLYASDQPELAKLETKALIFEQLNVNYRQLKATWGGASEYDDWMQRGWNNAKMSSVATYNELVPAFRALLRHFHGDFAAAYANVEAIAALQPQARERCLRTYLGAATTTLAGCPTEVPAATALP